MNTTIWVGINGVLVGYGVGMRVSLWIYRRAARRAAAEIQGIIQTGEEVIAESKARIPEQYDGEIQLPDTERV